MTTLTLVCGLPGSGKTSYAKTLHAVRLCPDEWLVDLGCDVFDAVARDRVEAIQWQLALDLVRRGQDVVCENGFWTRDERDRLLPHARTTGAGLRLVYLDLPLDELVRRCEARRDPPITRTHLEAWWSLFDPPTDAELATWR